MLSAILARHLFIYQLDGLCLLVYLCAQIGYDVAKDWAAPPSLLFLYRNLFGHQEILCFKTD